MTADQQNVTPQSAEEQGDEVPQWLRTLVIVLGVAIVVMIVLIVGTIVKRSIAGDEDSIVPQTAPEISATGPAKYLLPNEAPLDLTVESPAGAQLVYSQIAGREFLLHFKLEDDGDMIMTVDRVTGTVRRLRVVPAGARP